MISVESILNSPKPQQSDNLTIYQQQPSSSLSASVKIEKDDQSSSSKSYLSITPIIKKQKNDDNYFLEYKEKVVEIMQALDNVTNYELSQANNSNLPPEYYLLKRNYDVLYSLFNVC